MSRSDTLIQRVVGFPHVLADLRGQATTKLVLFVHDFMCSGAEQLPMQHMVATAQRNWANSNLPSQPKFMLYRYRRTSRF